MRLVTFFVIFPLILSAITARAMAENCKPVSGVESNLIIGEIKIINSDIFDTNNPDEGRAIHKLANALHIKTHQKTIQSLLLFQVGEVYQQQKVDETERLLRSKKYIHSASIYAEEVCDGKLVVVVKTSDNWTLTPSISIGRSGGVNRSSVEIAESNLFGLGKSIVYKSDSNEDRDSRFVEYLDQNVLSSRYQIAFKKADNSDGYYDWVRVRKPFYSLDSKWALSLSYISEEKNTSIYEKSHIIDVIGQQTDSINTELGWSDGLHDKKVLRYKFGWQVTDNSFFNVEEFADSLLPENTEKHYPYFAVQYLQDLYIQRENFNVMAVVEDISIGQQINAKIGLLDKSLGSIYDGFIVSANYSTGIDISQKTLAFINLAINSEINKKADDFNTLSFSGNWFYYQDYDNSYYLKARYKTADNLLPVDLFVIGGDTGLRGYPIRFQTGHNLMLLSAEKRKYFDWYPYKLMKMGVAFYADTGSAWKNNEEADFISDVGIGLRLVSTRQADSKVIHIDLAYPLDKLEDVDNYQISVKAKARF